MIDSDTTPKLTSASGRYGHQLYFNELSPLWGQFPLGASGGPAGSSARTARRNDCRMELHSLLSGSVTYFIEVRLGSSTARSELRNRTNCSSRRTTNVKVGLYVLGIPGTNMGALPWSGGMPILTSQAILLLDQQDFRLLVSSS